jgi:hypothetical protein
MHQVTTEIYGLGWCWKEKTSMKAASAMASGTQGKLPALAKLMIAIPLLVGLSSGSAGDSAVKMSLSKRQMEKAGDFLITLIPAGARYGTWSTDPDMDDVYVCFTVEAKYPAFDVMEHIRGGLKAAGYYRSPNPWNLIWCDKWDSSACEVEDRPLKWWERLFRMSRCYCHFQWYEDWRPRRGNKERYISLHYDYVFIVTKRVCAVPAVPDTETLQVVIHNFPVAYRHHQKSAREQDGPNQRR